jgi:hypothetical protein
MNGSKPARPKINIVGDKSSQPVLFLDSLNSKREALAPPLKKY